jgi:alpha-N-arabinofuranosidase
MNHAVEFDEEDWFETMRLAGRMDEYITRHSAIMDRYDPEKRVALIVDEWGNWFRVEAGTEPGFLYQQNTLRDAVTAGLTLNIFNRHCARLRMANLAQTVNVLQALVLTDGPRAVVTPTYHVFDLYQAHQDAVRLPIDLACRDYVRGEEKIPALSASASRDQSATVHITLCNLDPSRESRLACELRGADPVEVSARVLAADALNAHNTFQRPDRVKPAPLESASLREGRIEILIPPASVVLLTVRTGGGA